MFFLIYFSPMSFWNQLRFFSLCSKFPRIPRTFVIYRPLIVAFTSLFRGISSKMSLSAIRVTIFGPISALKAYDTSRISAYVDLNGYSEGIHNLPIRFSYDGAIAYLTFEPATETATVELIAEQTD